MFLKVAESTGDLVFITDWKRTLLYVNRSACETTGYRENELLGASEGVPGQCFALKHRPVVPGGAANILEVSGIDGWQEWKQAQHFVDSTAEDRHFVLDAVSGEVQLGPGVREPDGAFRNYGAVPPKGSRLRLRSYLIGGGRKELAGMEWRIAFLDDGEEFNTKDYISDFFRLPSQEKENMDKYQKLPKTENGDWGGVHTNSGIHNKAAYNMLTAKDAQGSYLLKPRDVAALFYLALSQNLSRTSRFGDSRRGVELAARSLFANKGNKQERFKAVAKAFDKVGIV